MRNGGVLGASSLVTAKTANTLTQRRYPSIFNISIYESKMQLKDITPYASKNNPSPDK